MRADIKVTRDLIRAGQLPKKELFDHVIMGNGNRSSLRKRDYFHQSPPSVSESSEK